MLTVTNVDKPITATINGMYSPIFISFIDINQLVNGYVTVTYLNHK